MIMEQPATDWTGLLRTWAALGAELMASRSAPVTDWTAAKRMIEAVRPKMEEDAKRLRGLLEQSRKKLEPLGEPFELDLGLHRWLDAEREEAYSDWLEWVVRQAQTPSRVFKLFGLVLPNDLKQDALIQVEREMCIPYGHEGREGRLDLVITFGDRAIIVIEIKKGDADGSDTGKHPGYIKWRDCQPHKWKEAVFLAVAAEAEEYEGFSFLSWADVCISMRGLAIDLCKESRVTAAAMVLAFVGAVEQNLLGFSAEVIRSVCNGNRVFFNAAVVDHLASFVESMGDSNGPQSPARI